MRLIDRGDYRRQPFAVLLILDLGINRQGSWSRFSINFKVIVVVTEITGLSLMTPFKPSALSMQYINRLKNALAHAIFVGENIVIFCW